MKYLKTYERKLKSKFKVGDYVYAIDSKPICDLKTDVKYQIDEYEIYSGSIYYTLKNFSDTFAFVESRFISELEYETNKYNL